MLFISCVPVGHFTQGLLTTTAYMARKGVCSSALFWIASWEPLWPLLHILILSYRAELNINSNYSFTLAKSKCCIPACDIPSADLLLSQSDIHPRPCAVTLYTACGYMCYQSVRLLLRKERFSTAIMLESLTKSSWAEQGQLAADTYQLSHETLFSTLKCIKM